MPDKSISVTLEIKNPKIKGDLENNQGNTDEKVPEIKPRQTLLSRIGDA